MLGFFGSLLIGFFIGLIARFLKPGNNKMGLIMTILVGIGGAMIATYGGQFVGLYYAGETAGFIGSVVGALILLAVFDYIGKRRS